MIQHAAFLELAAVAIDFDLTPGERTRLEAHLATCPACRATAAAFLADAHALAILPVAPLPSRRAAARLDAILAPARPGLGALRLLAVAALLALLAVGSILVGAELLRQIQQDDPLVVVPSPSASIDPDASPTPSPVEPAAEAWGVVDLAAPGVLQGVTTGGPGLVAVGTRSEAPAASTVWTSSDGVTWTIVPDQDSLDLGAMVSVATGPAGLVAVGRPESTFSEGSAIWTSADGRTWVGVPGPTFAGMLDLTSVVVLDGRYFAGGTVGDAGVIASDDGTTWQILWQDQTPAVGPTELAAAGSVTAMTAYADGLAAAVSPGATIRLSADGATWRSVPGPEAQASVNDMAAWNGGLIAVGYDQAGHGAIWLSGNGATWRRVVDLGASEPRAVSATDSGLVLAAHTVYGTPSIMTSTDGETWATAAMGAEVQAGTLAIGLVPFGGGMVGVGGTGGPVTLDMHVAAWRGPLPAAPDAVPSPTPSTGPTPPASPVPSATSPVNATIGATWARTTLPDSSVSSPGGGSMDGIIAGGPGAIAWGQAYGEVSRIWTTTDGRTWERATVEAPAEADQDIEMPGFISSISAGGPGFVAAGWYDRQDTGRRGVIWTSIDGREWDLVPQDPAFENVLISNVIVWRGELLAYGVVSYGPDEGQGDQRAWSSTDGLTWKTEVLSMPTGLRHGVPVVGGDRLWAAGEPAGADPLASWQQTCWLTSPDGMTWSVATLPFHPGSVAPVSDGLSLLTLPAWMTGSSASDRLAPGAYRSTDLETWQLVSEDGSPYGELIEVGGTTVVVGDDSDADHSCPGACRPMAWRSLDRGATWQAIPVEAVDGSIFHVAALPDATLVAVGTVYDAGGETSPAAWVSPAG